MYEIHCGTRMVSRVEAPTPRYAVTDYLRSLGCREDELAPMGDDRVAWRGAVYTAVESKAPSRPSLEFALVDPQVAREVRLCALLPR